MDWKLGGLIGLAAWLGAAEAALGTGFYTGQKLLTDMEDSSNTVMEMAAKGYITGVFDAEMAYGKVCPSPGITAGQLAAMTESHLKAHPEIWNYSAHSILAVLFRQTWPCHEAAPTPTKPVKPSI